MKLAGLLIAIALLCIAVPPFHVRRTDAPGGTVDRAAPEAMDPAAYAQRFWSEQLVAAGAGAADVQMLLEALHRDANAAAQQFGHRAGLGGPAYFLVRGEGQVHSTDRKGVRLELVNGEAVLLVTGPVFGNALRDATGLISVGGFSSFEFNALSSELNRIAETRVQPGIVALAQPGARLRFTGCAEFTQAGVLKVIPVEVAAAS